MIRQAMRMGLVLGLGLLLGGTTAAQTLADVAKNTGYRDGMEKGRNDARQAKSFNLERHDAYKDADHGYRSRLGSKEDYRQQYRESFRAGYEKGYRGDSGRRPRFGEDRPFERPEPRYEPRGTDYSELARNNGYRDGLESGRSDAQNGRSFDVERHDAYYDADRGYRSSFGSREEYRQQYREAFRRGYDEGHRGERRRPRDGDRPYQRPEPRPEPRGPEYVEVARNTGYRDGLEKGANDARQRKSFQLERHDAYKDADHGYRSSFGNKEQYKQEYREAFRRGYEEGYRSRR